MCRRSVGVCLNCTGVDGEERREEEQISIESTWSLPLPVRRFSAEKGAMFGDACEDDDDGREQLAAMHYYRWADCTVGGQIR